MATDPGADTDVTLGRKRRHAPTMKPPIICSDSDTESEARMAVKARRGKAVTRGRGAGLGRARSELAQIESEAREEAFERSLRSRAFRKEPAQIVDPEESSGCEVGPTLDPANCDVEELRANAGRSAAFILEIAQKSSNLKGAYIKKLKDAASALQAIVDTLASRTEAEETRRLRADNGRLRREIDNLKAELKAHRREFAEMRSSMADTRQSNVTPTIGADLVEELRASIVSSVGLMIDARLAGIEERLLPEKSHRPPLAAEKGRKNAPPTPVATTFPVESSQALVPTAPTTTRNTVSKKAMNAAVPTLQAVPSTSVAETNVQAANNGDWVTVVRRGKKKANPAGESTGTNLSTPVSRPPQAAKPKLSAPRTAAVIVTLQPEAEKKGVTYTQIMERAANSIDLVEMGIGDGFRIRRSATGARLLELPKSQTPEMAEQLAQKLRVTLDGVASVVRPTKCVEIRITGLDDSVTKDQVVAAVARTGNCPIDIVKSGEVHAGPGGMGMVVVRCPITTAKALSDAGRVLVGWSSAKVKALEQRPLRCFRCMGIGHTSPVCPSGAARGELCFRCGLGGHKSWECTGTLRCAVCADAGKPAGHVMGGRNCCPPITKGKAATGTRAAPRIESRQAQEETVMSS